MLIGCTIATGRHLSTMARSPLRIPIDPRIGRSSLSFGLWGASDDPSRAESEMWIETRSSLRLR
jgi:hypothetical protein